MPSEPRQVIRLTAASPVETLAALRALTDRLVDEDESAQLTPRDIREAVRLMDEFLAALSQDLRSPLTVIKGRAQILQRQARHADPHTEALIVGLTAIEEAVERLASRIDELQL